MKTAKVAVLIAERNEPDEPSHFDNERTSFYSRPIRPSFVEVEQ